VRVLVIGGTHFVGRHAVVEAAERRHEVTVFHRGESEPGEGFPDVEHLHGDRDGGLPVLAGSSWDAVLDTCGYVPRVVRHATQALERTAAHYTFVSSLSAYADDVVPGATEETPSVDPSPDDEEEVTGETYGPMKVACERLVTEAFPGRASIVRPGFIVGRNDPMDRFAYWARRADQGGEVLAPEPRDMLVQLVDARDLATFMIDGIEAKADGVFNVTGPAEPLTMGELLQACIEVAGSDGRLTWVAKDFLRERGMHDPGEHGWEQLPYWYPEELGFAAFDVSKAIGAGLRFRPLRETIADTLAWDRARDRSVPLSAGITPERERGLLEEWRAAEG
jgi:2'-hydroxyisoflavone reductase